jgi:DNA-binding PadR family transcriptional regulator
LIKAAEAAIVVNLRMGRMDNLIKSLLKTLDKEPMTPHQLAEKLEKKIGGIMTTLRFMSFEKWVSQDETTRMLHLTPLGRTYLRNLKLGGDEQLKAQK